MKTACILLFISMFGFIACQKEMSSTNQKTASTTDSLLGRWNIDKMALVEYDLNTAAIDTLGTYIDNNAFAEFNTDSSFMIMEDALFGFSGTFLVSQSREINMLLEKETFDNFGPVTSVFNPPHALTMHIQMLTDSSAILNFRTAQSNQNFTYRFHYFLKK